MIRIYNSLTRRKQDLTPLEPGHVRMYVCGMTVYDYCHLGHARVLVVFDTVSRYLRSRGLRVTYVRNITDIDDKIIRRAGENAEPIDRLTDRFIRAMREDAAVLGVLPPDQEPRATGHIEPIIDMIRRLEERGYAYRGDNGDVYYEVRRFSRYGQLSGESPDSLLSGARVEADGYKRDPLDFVLWKAARPGEPQWQSPWGPGRPGWHIECSAMSTHCLGNHFDIHAGGMDLRFPHHENEIAQSEAATGEKFADIWMHNGYVQIDQEKMSKSVGNFFTIREILATDDNRARIGEAIRFMVLRSHYRSPLNFSSAALEESASGLTRLYRTLDRAGSATAGTDIPEAQPWADRFHAAMSDDFGTPDAIAVLFDLANEVNRAEPDRGAVLGSTLRALGGILGLLQQDPATVLGMDEAAGESESRAEIDALVAARDAARRQRDWSEADRIRNELTARGILLEDSPDGTRWRRG